MRNRFKKKLLYRSIKTIKQRGKGIRRLCEVFSLSRDSYYKFHSRIINKQEKKDIIVKYTVETRKVVPRSGGRKTLKMISSKLKEDNIKIGRDSYFSLLKENDLLIERRKAYKRTTYSNHQYAVQSNKIKDFQVTSPNQVYVSDITYIPINGANAYLFLVSDLYSRKIVGYSLEKDLKHIGAIKALQMSVKGLKNANHIIHHSDRGCQYCCHEFLRELCKHKMISSMTDENHCYQNAVAERINGILKQEFFLDVGFNNFDMAKQSVKNAIEVYNKIRLHENLRFLTPEEVHQMAA